MQNTHHIYEHIYIYIYIYNMSHTRHAHAILRTRCYHLLSGSPGKKRSHW